VAIDIPEVLVQLRERVTDQAPGHRLERAAMKSAGWLLDHPAAYSAALRAATRARGVQPRRLPLPGPAKAWSDSRDLPELPERPFRDWWNAQQTGEDGTAR
jgi:L-lactate dehydrogenase complex protein LldF